MKTLLALALVIQLFLTGWWLKTASVVERQQQERLAEEKARYEVCERALSTVTVNDKYVRWLAIKDVKGAIEQEEIRPSKGSAAAGP